MKIYVHLKVFLANTKQTHARTYLTQIAKHLKARYKTVHSALRSRQRKSKISESNLKKNWTVRVA